MPRSREEIRRDRQQVKAMYGALFDDVAALLFHRDPMGINFDVNTDEYEPEVGTILPRLRPCRSADEVLRVVHEEFVRWFSPATVGPASSYAEIASEIWELWQRQGSTINILTK